MNLLQTARTIVLVVVSIVLGLFVLSSFLWLPIEARIVQIGGAAALLASMAVSRSRIRVSTALALGGSMLLSASSYLAVSDATLAAITGLAALCGALLPILIGFVDARGRPENQT